ncbi:IMP dehydrogenase [Candidatus Falkowbacteria bacterium CG10_big_fil_rev_8_21_14_0_10_37_6]|uniref:Inosine-5'-monophosphate dehydrogenase n=1 Tax=Candidatus Falkowbacteria bacterium CG10_big_fil_rev_8_21_14_0_10_37_6 TaxID=1974563 RepID=A0A2H0V6L2_9BACT|nr:MAG: IMP dehydrogenase [Candidatus Falkowbacteria bacterium CG10_big_fil_rev_8_21_14_0_10_37_6]
MQEMYTFNDLLLVPQYSEILPSQASLNSKFSRNIDLRLPLVSAPMDTVTEHEMAIALALSGGMGIIHKNLSVENQAKEVEKVKRFENGFIKDPITLTPDASVETLYKIRMEKGYKSVPVVDDNNKLLGIVGKLDYFWPHDKAKKIKDIMTPIKQMITASSLVSLKKANDIIRNQKLSVLCLIDKNQILTAIATRKDLEKNEMYPNANKAFDKSLRVGAAVGVGGDVIERAKMLAQKSVDAIIVDTAHGHSKGVIDTVKILKNDKQLKNVDIVAGNVATAEAVKDLIKAGVDAVKVGIGPGSICTTRIVAGIGVPQLSAIMDAVKGRGKTGVPVIADGGIKYSGDIVKAFAAGAQSVMIGSLFAGTDESPGQVEYYNGRMYKTYRGMGSIGAMMQGSKDRYGQAGVKDVSKFVPEGIEGRTLYRGPVEALIYQLAGGIKSGMGYNGAKTIAELHKKAKFIKISDAGLKESHPHDVEITKQAPNYS